MPLPGHAESYNPPAEYLLTAEVRVGGCAEPRWVGGWVVGWVGGWEGGYAEPRW